MDTHRLHFVALSIYNELVDPDIQDLLRELANKLNSNITAQSAEADEEFLSKLSELSEQLAFARSNDFTPSEDQLAKELHAWSSTGLRLKSEIDTIILSSGSAPGRAVEELRNVSQRVGEVRERLSNLVEALSDLDIGYYALEDTYEVGILVPTDVIDSGVAEFADYMQNVAKYFRLANLAFGENRDDVEPEIASVAKGSLELFLCISPLVAIAVVNVIERGLGIYEKALSIRSLKQQLKEEQIDQVAIDAVEDRVTAYVDEQIANLVSELEAKVNIQYPEDNEARNGVKPFVQYVLGEIDKGVSFEVRAPEDEEDTEEHEGELTGNELNVTEMKARIRNVSRAMGSLERSENRVLRLPGTASEKIEAESDANSKSSDLDADPNTDEDGVAQD